MFYKWNTRNSTGDVVYISEELEMPQFMITNVELEEKTNIYNIGAYPSNVFLIKQILYCGNAVFACQDDTNGNVSCG